MIGRLRGLLLEKQPPLLMVEVQGVGYEVQASLQTCCLLPATGKAVDLHTHFVVREDAQQLYGFYTREERDLFRILLKVNGVGPKLALTILSSTNPEEFTRCVQQQDTQALVKLPGVGKKTAERLMIEMRDRLNAWQDLSSNSLPYTESAPLGSARQEAASALTALGYKPQEAHRVIQELAKTHSEASREELIRLALKRINQ